MANVWTAELIQDALDLAWETFRDKHPQFSHDAWRRKRYAALHGHLPLHVAGDICVPKPTERPFTGPLHLSHANALILGDLHCPYHNETMLRRAFWLRKRVHKVDTAIIIGDLFNFEVISKHGIQGPYISLDAEFESVRRVLRAFAQHFKTVYITLGNHDRRLAKRLDATLTFQVLLDGALGAERGRCTFVATDFDYMYLDHPDGEERSWIVGHPSGYSGLGGKTPSDYAMVHRHNVITGHNHVVGESQSRCGQFLGIDTGHMTDPDKHHYLARSLTGYTRWNSGFVFLQDGYPHRYTERWSNWPALGCP